MSVAAISVVAGNNGTVTVGQLYPQNIVLYARQADFSPSVGVLLQVSTPTNPGGAFQSGAPRVSIVTTDATGHATCPTIRADGAVGGWTGHVIVAGVPSIATTFSMSATSSVPLVPTTLSLQSSMGTAVISGSAFGAQVVRLVDQFANPMPGQTITFAVPAVGNGTFAGGAISTTAVTNASGLATMPSLVSGTTLATFNMTASLLALTPVTVALTVSSGSVAASLTAISGSGQFTPPSTGFLHPLVVLVRNVLGVALAGVHVTVTKPGSGASCVIGSDFATDANGRVSASAIANTTAGAYDVTFSTSGVPDAVFHLTNQVSGTICTTAAYPTGFGTTPYLSGQPWANTEQILFDSTGATTVLASGQASNIIRGSTFGITIPDDCTLSGFKLTYKAKSSVAGGTITPYLFVSGSPLTGTPAAQALTTGMVAYQRGSSTDLWGNVYTIAQVNGSAFSCAFVARSPTGAKTISLSNVKLSVCYTTPQGVTVAAAVPASLLMDM